MAAEISQLLTELSALSHHDGRPETVRPHPNVMIPWHKSAMPQDGLRVAMRYPPGSSRSRSFPARQGKTNRSWFRR